MRLEGIAKQRPPISCSVWPCNLGLGYQWWLPETWILSNMAQGQNGALRTLSIHSCYPGPDTRTCILYSQIGSKGPTLILIICRHHLEILNNFWTRRLTFWFFTELRTLCSWLCYLSSLTWLLFLRSVGLFLYFCELLPILPINIPFCSFV